MSQNNRKDQRRRRHLRIRRRLRGTAERPRMAIYVSNRHLYVQFIDDVASRTLAATSSAKADVSVCNCEAARKVGELAAKVALEKGISQAVVDRGGFLYHGRVKNIVEAAAAAGLKLAAEAPATEGETK